eukprot:461593-Rhodomonas_salina.2
MIIAVLVSAGRLGSIGCTGSTSSSSLRVSGRDMEARTHNQVSFGVPPGCGAKFATQSLPPESIRALRRRESQLELHAVWNTRFAVGKALSVVPLTGTNSSTFLYYYYPGSSST